MPLHSHWAEDLDQLAQLPWNGSKAALEEKKRSMKCWGSWAQPEDADEEPFLLPTDRFSLPTLLNQGGGENSGAPDLLTACFFYGIELYLQK